MSDRRDRGSVPAAAVAAVSGLVMPVLGSAWLRARRRRRLDEIVHEAALGFAGADSEQAVLEIARRASDRVATVHSGTGRALKQPQGQTAIAFLERAARRRLATGAAASAALVEQATDVILVVDDHGQIGFASPSSRALFGTSMLRGRLFLDFVEPASRPAAEFLLHHVRHGGPTDDGPARADLTVQAADGRTAQAELLCRDLRSDQAVRGLVLTLRDVTGRRQLEHELTRHVYWDPVAGLPNRVSFHEALSRALAADTGITAVYLIDVARFRMVNETLGRAVGDRVLHAVGQRLRSASGEHNLTARLGGDEFAVLVTDNDHLDAVDEMAGRLMQALAEPVSAGDNAVTLGFGMGVAATTKAETEQELMRNADVALDAAKAAGPGIWRRYDASMVEAVQYRLELRSALDDALRDGSLVLQYQPIVSLRSGWTVGFEALVRWQHPTRGLISPAEFIGIAEDSELIYPIGEHVLRSGMAAARQWTRSDDSAPPYISINVSVRQFRAPSFIDMVRQVITDSGLAPDRLTLEITESLLLRDDDRTWEDLNRLRGWGVRIAIDDFGTGYSALGYLRQVPLDIVKIDRIFISTMVTSRRQRDLVRGMVGLVRTLDLDVVAEGIETAGQRDICASIGCAYGQGYLFAHPMPQDDAVSWLEHKVRVPTR